MKVEKVTGELFDQIVRVAVHDGGLSNDVSLLTDGLNVTHDPCAAGYLVAMNPNGYAVVRLNSGVPCAIVEKED